MAGTIFSKIIEIARERLYVKSDLNRYYKYFGYTNSIYVPQKTYKSNRRNAGFWIHLHEAGNEQYIVMPKDYMDGLVIEAQLIPT
jgi:hypothetical protein